MPQHHKETKTIWVVNDCGRIASESGCKLKIMGPEMQIDDVLDAAVDHSVAHHSHDKSDALREDLRATLVYTKKSR